jgi:NAD(P)-dependent dehydrogenase (short-subunit alcohol dehydrogenase family)
LEVSAKIQEILVTGGTSGLGNNFVMAFIEKGFHVITTGRRDKYPAENVKGLSYYKVDYCDLGNVSAVMAEIAEHHSFDIIINNAGILSPNKRTLTGNGLECTFQVNFLSHLLASEILLERKKDEKPLTIASITSPVYRYSGIGRVNDEKYNAMKAYSGSKLYMALMAEYLSRRYTGVNLKCISLDPGVFSSAIYRSQTSFFGVLYRTAAPFMRDPSKVAASLSAVITREQLAGNLIYDSRGKASKIPVFDGEAEHRFWKECQELIDPFKVIRYEKFNS